MAVVAPTWRQAQIAALDVSNRLGRRCPRPFTLPTLLAAREPPLEIILCPAGKSVASDLRFLEEARERALWAAPRSDLQEAIAGLLGNSHAGLPRASRRRGNAKSALLLEGVITAARVANALGSPERHWIIDHVGRVRLSARALRQLRERGVHWSVLRPLRVVALLASADLARERSRWRHLLPARTAVWVSPRLTAAGSRLTTGKRRQIHFSANK